MAIRSSAARLGLVGLIVLWTALGPTSPARAVGGTAWSADAQRTGGAVTMARLSAAFVPKSSPGVPGPTFSAQYLLFGEVATVDLANTGTAPLIVNGLLVLTPVVSGSIEVWTCSLAYVGATCPSGGVSRLVGSAAGLGQRVVSYSGTELAVGAALHLKVVFAGGLYSSATGSVTFGAARAAADRTQG